jgi:hypothetical protein
MKTVFVATLVLLSCARVEAAQLTLCLWEANDGFSKKQPEFSEVRTASGREIYLSPPLFETVSPAEMLVEWREIVSVNQRDGEFGIARRQYFTVPFSKEQLDLLVERVPKDKATSLAVAVNGTVVGVTPFTRDWRKWACAVAYSTMDSADTKFLEAAGVKVIKKPTATKEGTPKKEEGTPMKETPPKAADPQKRPRIYRGAINDMVCSGTVDNPVHSEVTLSEKSYLCFEPMKVALSVKNIGIDQATFRPLVFGPGKLKSNVRAMSGPVVEAPEKVAPPQTKGQERLYPGDSAAAQGNLTRELGCEFARAGTGPVSLQFRLLIGTNHPMSRCSDDAWMNLPAPEVKVEEMAEGKFTPIKAVPVTGTFDQVRLGNYPLDGKTLTIAVFSKANKTGRILRLDPNADPATSWEMAWDSKTQQLHILQHSPKARYWMSAADQKDWEVRLDVKDYSKLETKDGVVRRVE